MSLGVLNNIAAIYAQNNLNNTQNSLQNTLTQLSSGSRINSGADDAAGLAVADGLHANVAALTQSAQNASDGIGLLQTADGALSQVTNLLNRAVTLATETANGTLTTTQASTANQEYQNILTQIASIGSTTNFNSQGVFSNTARTVFVSDGSAAGANVYSAITGGLTSSSVGQTIAAPITTSAVAPVTIAPVAAVANTAGVYTLTPAAASDTLSGNLSFRVGTTGTVQNVTVAAGTTLGQLATQLTASSAFTAAGLSAGVSGGVLTITGGTSGANAAANTVNFAGTALTDLGPAQTLSTGVTTGAGTAGAQQTSSLAFTGAGVAAGDNLSGTFSYTLGSGSPATISLAGTTLDTTANTGIVDTLNNNAAFHAAGLTASLVGTTLTVKATAGPSPTITLDGTGITDTSHSATITPTNNSTTGAVGTAAYNGITALTSATSVFSTGAALTINGTSVSVAGLNGTAAAAAITANSTLAAAGITAAFNTSTKVLTITGNANSGAAVTVTGTQLAANTKATVTSLVTATAATGSAATGATSTITLGSLNDTLAGTLNVVVGTSGLPAQSLSLTIAPNTTGDQLASQINQNKAFQAANVTAKYDNVAGTVTLTGPVGAANTIATTGTALTDSSSALAGAGVDFTQTTIATLSATTAQNVLTSVTSAIADVAYQRGIIGADVNEFTAASGVAQSESENLTAAENSIRSTNYGNATSDLAKLKVLSETGISALAQANSVQQEVEKLLQ